VEDGSCEFSGCTDPKAQNFDPAANVDDGSCCYSDGECSDIDGFTYLQENDQGYDEFRHDETGIDFVLVPGGEFEMGSPDSEPNRDEDEGPVHTVTLSPFLIAKYECTQAQYAQVMQGHPTLEATASLSPNPSRFTGDVQRPVEQVSWTDLKDADGFLARTGLSLPSEAQWEYACRGGTTTVFSFGDECNNDEGNVHTCNPCAAADDSMWWCGNAGRTTHPVGEKLPNPFGLHDMHGNVFEWCQDWFKDGFYDELVDSGEPAIDPICRDSGSGFRVFRGGSWNDYAWGCRSADRYGYRPDNRDSNYGFRPLRPLP
jgi:formylglycine-generating enzyme required for sulfatase activity